MADFILMDDQNVDFGWGNLKDDAGNAVGAIPAGASATYALANDPSNALAITPSADTLSVNVKALGPIASGMQVLGTLTVPGITNPINKMAAIDTVLSPPTDADLVPSTPVHN